MHLADLAQKVYLIYRGTGLRAEPTLVDQLNKNQKIEIIYQINITQILPKPDQEIVGGVKLDKPYKNLSTLNVDGVFIEIGGIPRSILAQQIGVNLDEKGFIKVDEDLKTNIEGVFAAGDVTSLSKDFGQVIWAAGQGARAAVAAYSYLQKTKAPKILGI